MIQRTWMFGVLARALTALVFVPTTGCARVHVALADEVDVASGVPYARKPSPVEKIDVLLVVDNSQSMTSSQMLLRRELPAIAQVLASGDLEAAQAPDSPGFGVVDFPAPLDMHFAVTTADLGTRPYDICSRPLGDDGKLIAHISSESPAGCEPWPAPFLRFDSRNYTDRDDRLDAAAKFGLRAGCVATTGTHGCMFEQPLEAMLKALLPGGALTFLNSDSHGDEHGFLRSDSLLVVVVLTDEEDCSVSSSDVFDLRRALPVQLDPRFQGANTTNYRCAGNLEGLRPIERYIDGLRLLREDPRDLVFAAIVGVPLGLGDTSLADVLKHEAMRYEPTLDPLSGHPTVRLAPACVSKDGDRIADPARRIVSLARSIEEGRYGVRGQASVHSICDDDFRPAITSVLEAIVARSNAAFD